MKSFLLSLLFVVGVNSQCVDINTSAISNMFNTSYHHDCYQDTIEMSNCCEYFLLNTECHDNYKYCSEYDDYVINNIKNQCHMHNQTLDNITYSDKCHNFTLHLEPNCCSDILECRHL